MNKFLDTTKNEGKAGQIKIIVMLPHEISAPYTNQHDKNYLFSIIVINMDGQSTIFLQNLIKKYPFDCEIQFKEFVYKIGIKYLDSKAIHFSTAYVYV